MTRSITALLTILWAAFFVPAVTASAKPSHYPPVTKFNNDRYASVAQDPTAREVTNAVRCPPPACVRSKAKARHVKHPRKHRQHPIAGTVERLSMWGGVSRELRTASTIILGGRPAGCPRQFCGCGASLYLFGKIIPSLNLAANWLRFERASPAPNMVAARRGHVFVLKSHIAGNVWMVHDSNSGHHRTRMHPRSIVGYKIVNPRGARA